MASLRGWRVSALGLIAAVCTMTFSVSAPAYFDSGGTQATASTYDNVIVISFVDVRPSALDILALVKEDRVASDFPAFRPKAVKERASRSAVRPTAVSGWRSGRTRTLAA